MRKRVGLAATVVAVAVPSVTACRGDDSGSTAGTSGSGDSASSTAATTADACALITIDEVAAITQVEVTPDPQPSSPTACSYDSPDSGIFNAVNDPTAAATALMKTALDRV